MAERIIVACSGDWHTGAVLDTLNRLRRQTLFITFEGNPLASRSWQYIQTVTLAVPFFFKVGSRIESQTRGFSDSISNFWRLRWFDKQVAHIITQHAPTHCFLWAAMAECSIRHSRKVGAKSILFLGSTPFFFKLERERAGEVVREITKWTESQMSEFETSDTIWVESPFLIKPVEQLPVSTMRIISLTPPINLDDLTAERNTSEFDPLRVVTVQGSLRKGTRLLFEIWPELPPAARLSIFGTLERQLRRDLPKNVTYHGNLPRSAYLEQLADNSVAVFPTYGDGGPRALFETMAMGLCPIASDASAATEVIRDGVSGFVIPSGDAVSLKDKLLWCIAHPNETRRMGEAARESIIRTHNKEAFTQTFQKHFLT